MRHRHAHITGRLASLLMALLLAAGALTLGACSTITVGEQEPETPVGQIVPAKLAIIHTAGMAGAFEGSSDSLGIAAIAQLRTNLEEQGYDVMLLDSGNTLAQPAGADLSDGEVAVAYLNATSYDAVLASTGELALGRQTLDRRTSQADFALLSANLMDDGTDSCHFTPSQTVKLSDGRLVGVFALTASDATEELSPFDAQGLAIDQQTVVETAQKNVDELQEQGCKLVVCLCDLGRSKREGAVSARELAASVDGIDIVLDVTEGTWEQDFSSEGSDDGTLLVRTPEGLTGATVATWERGVKDASLVEAGSIEGTDEQVSALVTQTGLETEKQLAAELTTSGFQLDGEAARGAQNGLGDLVADAVLWTAQSGSHGTVHAAIVDQGSIVSGLPKGTITRRDAFGTCPHATTRLYLVEVSGQRLLDCLAKDLVDPNIPNPQIAGMQIKLVQGKDDKQPPQVKIESIGGKPFSSGENYVIATTEGALFGGTALFELASEDLSNITSLDTSGGKALCDYLARKCRPTLPSSYAKAEERISRANDSSET